MDEKRLNNELTKIYKAFDYEMTNYYINLYPTNYENIKEIFSTLHHCFVECFELMNQRLPTGDYGAHYWADSSRKLLKCIGLTENLYRLLQNTKYAFEIDDYYKKLITRCKTFLTQSGGSPLPTNMEKVDIYYEIPIFVIGNENSFVRNSTKELKEAFSSEYISKQIDIMVGMQAENPTETIGKSKELIESCCKTIFEERKKTFDNNWTVSQTVKETMKLLGVSTENVKSEDKIVKAILGNLHGIAGNIAELRNAHGSGHGKGASYRGLKEHHAKLAIGSSTTLVQYLWDIHRLKMNV